MYKRAVTEINLIFWKLKFGIRKAKKARNQKSEKQNFALVFIIIILKHFIKRFNTQSFVNIVDNIYFLKI